MKGGSGDIDQMIGGVYEAAIYPERWKTLIRDLGKPVQCQSGHIMSFSSSGEKLVDCFRTPDGTPEENVFRLHDEYIASGVQPRLNFAAGLTSPSITVDYMHSSEAEMGRDDFYQTTVKELDTQYYGAVILPGSDKAFVGFGMFRSARQGHFDEQDVAYVKLLMPHLQRSMALMRHNHKAALFSQEGTLSSEVQAIVLDYQGRVSEVSDAALRKVKRCANMAIEKRRIIIFDSFAQRELDQQISDCIVALKLQQAIPRYVVIPNGDRKYPLYLMISPLRSTKDQLLDFAGVVYIIDPNDQPYDLQTSLSKNWQLTPAESRIAVHLFTGGSLKEFTEINNLSMETPRYHLKNIFSKLNISKQSQLIRLISQLV